MKSYRENIKKLENLTKKPTFIPKITSMTIFSMFQLMEFWR